MGNPPSGVVTFLFTDMEGSTRRWEEYPRQMELALARHDTLLRDSIEANGGLVFKTVGDAFHAAFPSAQQGLEAAVAAQRALQSEQWDDLLGGIKVRMALHTGEAGLRGGDYFGPTLNRVARLLAAGHGGQVLLSGATHALVRDALPSSVTSLDMGEHRLKDLYRPERIFQIIIEGLLSEFPPLNTLDNRRNNLPVQLTTIVGREKETAAVSALLRAQDVHLVTLTGPGGTGKTRLAQQVAAEMLDTRSFTVSSPGSPEAFPDGVWFVDLAPISDPALMVSTVAQTLGIKEVPGEPLIGALEEYLKEKAMLLVLDNFEQLLGPKPDSAGPALEVSRLIASCPSLKVLVTSTVPLHIRGEREYPVPPLSLPPEGTWRRSSPEVLTQYEAVRLFVERATDIKLDFQVTSNNAPAVAEICARLDGLPLAIELAAARIRLLTPQAMLTRLSSRLKLLTGGTRDVATRQQTLRNTIDWSYGLLSDGEKQLFRRLAVFQGGRSLEAIVQVCNAGGDLQLDALEGVESLAARSLLKSGEGVGGEPRFWMLETIHEYGREKMEESGEAEELRRRHARYYLELAEKADVGLRGPDMLYWRQRLQEKQDNMRSALRWAHETDNLEWAVRLAWALSWFWHVQGAFAERNAWIEELARKDAASLPDPARVRLLLLESLITQELTKKRALLGEAVTVARAAGDGPGLAHALHGLGTHYRVNPGNQLAAQASLQESLALFSSLGDRWHAAMLLSNLGFLARSSGDYRKARSYFEQSLAMRREVGDPEQINSGLYELGFVEVEEGNYDKARSLFQQSLESWRALQSRWGIALALISLGEVARLQGEYATARACNEEALALSEQIGRGRDDSCLQNLGNIAIREGQYEQARNFFMEGLARRKHLSRSDIGLYVAGLAGTEGAAAGEGKGGDPYRVARLFSAASAIFTSVGYVPEAADKADYERNLAMARAQLTEEEWQLAWEEGRGMSVEQAVEYALEASEHE